MYKPVRPHLFISDATVSPHPKVLSMPYEASFPYHSKVPSAMSYQGHFLLPFRGPARNLRRTSHQPTPFTTTHTLIVSSQGYPLPHVIRRRFIPQPSSRPSFRGPARNLKRQSHISTQSTATRLRNLPPNQPTLRAVSDSSEANKLPGPMRIPHPSPLQHHLLFLHLQNLLPSVPRLQQYLFSGRPELWARRPGS